MYREEDNIISTSNITADRLNLPELADRHIEATVLRLDKIHPVISGNKWFKLKYHLREAIETGRSAVVTFGGAWSNHIVATACAAHALGLSSVGIIRGERPNKPSSTLLAAESFGMLLHFVNREAYVDMQEPSYRSVLHDKYPGSLIIPEGGGGKNGIKGSGEILELVDAANYTHILCAIGTGTMYCGLVNRSAPGQKIIGIPVLKGMENILQHYKPWINPAEKIQDCTVFANYHFGGYAKKTTELLNFMNSFFGRSAIPSDFVYTGKLFYAVSDLLRNHYFPAYSRLLIVHSGGLQGNASLQKGQLLF